MTASPPLSWVQRIEEDVSSSKVVPLWGSPPPFPWDRISESLQKDLGIKDAKLRLERCDFLRPEQFLTPFGQDPRLAFFALSPLQGSVVWVISSESLQKIAAAALTGTATGGFSEPAFQQGFYQFLLLEIAALLEREKVYEGLQIQQLDAKALPATPSPVLDLSLSFGGDSVQGRLIVPPEFHTAFAARPFPKSVSEKSPPDVDAVLLLEAGSCALSREEWSEVARGDLVILERCSYDPETGSGTAMLTFAEKPCLIVKIKKTGVKILDYAVYQGDPNTMDEEFAPDSFDEESPLPGVEASEPDEDMPIPTEEEKSPLTPPPEVLTSAEKIPFPIVLELDRIKISLDKLLHLSPGNILELTVRPEQGVYLTVRGKKIARGELVKIGEVLGVKIVEIGSG